LDERVLKRQVAIIDSMTPQERRSPDVLKASRKKRIAAGSGTRVEDVNRMLKMHRGMADLMKAMGSGKRGPRAGVANMLGLGGGMAGGGERGGKGARRDGGGDGRDGPAGRGAPPASRPPCPVCRRNFPAVRCCPGLAASPPASAGYRDWGRRSEHLRRPPTLK